MVSLLVLAQSLFVEATNRPDDNFTVIWQPGHPDLDIVSITFIPQDLEVNRRGTMIVGLTCSAWSGSVRDVLIEIRVVGNMKLAITSPIQSKLFTNGDFSSGFAFDVLPLEEGLDEFTISIYEGDDELSRVTESAQIMKPWLERNLPSILGSAAIVVCLIAVVAYTARRPSRSLPPPVG